MPTLEVWLKNLDSYEAYIDFNSNVTLVVESNVISKPSKSNPTPYNLILGSLHIAKINIF